MLNKILISFIISSLAIFGLADSIINISIANNIESNTTTKTRKNEDSKQIKQNTKDEQKDIDKEHIIIVENGKTAIITTEEKNPKPLKIGSKNIEWLTHPKDKTKHIAIIPIHYYEKKQDFSLHINEGQILRVKYANYKKENIKVSDKNKVTPNQNSKERIEKERQEAIAIYKVKTKTRYWNLPFVYPIESKITSPFGSARVFNGEVKSYHGGTDFRASIGRDIKAINDGVVVIAKDRFLAGKSVVIDHGEGIYSQYYHCSDINVKVGDKVKKSQVIALSGDTGRVSAPHLHFGIMINSIQIDPLHFIESMNAL
ncbi:M23 family metallopeptidase [Helicobacter muridarum]|uniref:M23 family metallopeptidase n=1 Tax=Helicobacter muridarum TaxID=216 RepID=A0A377PWV3_9HELI|nr:M23 family metallopeptidase [Helicobacter muridarum]TLE00060.1 M23 family metallopeptidase [Helicobacter muridarum]STQ86093.1 M23/M37 family peptidase [Helicobacter muridarum]